MESIEDKVLAEIRKDRKGALFFTEDFVHLGNGKAVAKALERLVKADGVTRVARGIYARPEADPEFGPIKPGAEDIAKAIGRRDRARIVPTGAAAMNALGLSTQVPVNPVYLTDGTPRKISLGRRRIVFKKASPKSLSAKGRISGLAIQAMKEIGREGITERDVRVILGHLSKEDPKHLEHDIRLAPEWIRKIMRQALEKLRRDGSLALLG